MDILLQFFKNQGKDKHKIQIVATTVGRSTYLVINNCHSCLWVGWVNGAIQVSLSPGL